MQASARVMHVGVSWFLWAFGECDERKSFGKDRLSGRRPVFGGLCLFLLVTSITHALFPSLTCFIFLFSNSLPPDLPQVGYSRLKVAVQVEYF